MTEGLISSRELVEVFDSERVTFLFCTPRIQPNKIAMPTTTIFLSAFSSGKGSFFSQHTVIQNGTPDVLS